MKVITGFIADWHTASKTAALKAKPIVNLLVDNTVASKFLIDTLEGKQPLGKDNMFCIGQAGDAWQQPAKKLLAKYTVTAIEDGWLVCTPKPDNVVNCVEFTRDWVDATSAVRPNTFKAYPDDRMYNLGDFAVEGQWGEVGYPELGKNIQWGNRGDFICQNQSDPTDVWIVRRSLFLNTYIFLC